MGTDSHEHKRPPQVSSDVTAPLHESSTPTAPVPLPTGRAGASHPLSREVAPPGLARLRSGAGREPASATTLAASTDLTRPVVRRKLLEAVLDRGQTTTKHADEAAPAADAGNMPWVEPGVRAEPLGKTIKVYAMGTDDVTRPGDAKDWKKADVAKMRVFPATRFAPWNIGRPERMKLAVATWGPPDKTEEGFVELSAVNTYYNAKPGPVHMKFDAEYQRSENPVFGEKGPRPEDVKQGISGECWLLAPMMAIAGKDGGKAVKDMIRENGNGTVTVRFWRREATSLVPDYVTVTTRVLEKEQLGFSLIPRGISTGASSEVGGCLWPALVVKAYAVWSNNKRKDNTRNRAQQDVSGGWADESMTAFLGKAEKHDAKAKSTPDKLKETFAQDPTAMVSASTGKGANTTAFLWGVQKAHVYRVTGADARGVTLQNPWGRSHAFRGDSNRLLISWKDFATKIDNVVFGESAVKAEEAKVSRAAEAEAASRARLQPLKVALAQAARTRGAAELGLDVAKMSAKGERLLRASFEKVVLAPADAGAAEQATATIDVVIGIAGKDGKESKATRSAPVHISYRTVKDAVILSELRFEWPSSGPPAAPKASAPPSAAAPSPAAPSPARKAPARKEPARA
jgi:hypothetical protein